MLINTAEQSFYLVFGHEPFLMKAFQTYQNIQTAPRKPQFEFISTELPDLIIDAILKNMYVYTYISRGLSTRATSAWQEICVAFSFPHQHQRLIESIADTS